MCIHEFYLSTVCGHYFPKVQPEPREGVFFDDHQRKIAVPQSLTCAPVKLALKFYHDQVVYLPADMNCGSKIEIPRSCPIVHDSPPSLKDEEFKKPFEEQWKADEILRNAMLRNGLSTLQIWQVDENAAVLDQCSNRAKPGQHNPAELRRHRRQEYPLNMWAHVQSVKAYQARDKRYMRPNVRYFEAKFGCGGPFSPACLRDWDGTRLLTHRLHLWSDSTTHPKPCDHQCLTGWSGDHLDTYRRQNWPNNDPTLWSDVGYAKFASEHLLEQAKDWVAIDFKYISHMHADQWEWNGTRLVRIEKLPSGHKVRVPETVRVPVTRRLHQVLFPNTRGSESGTTAVDEHELAEERRQKARQEMREKLARDFPAGEGEVVVEGG